jgi:hypothetical protein
MWTLSFWKDVLERSLKTGAQAIVLGLGLAEGFDLFSMDWQAAGGFFLGGMFLSVLTSVISAPIRGTGTASLVRNVEYRA